MDDIDDDPPSFLLEGAVDDPVFRALSAPERRFVLYLLLDRERIELPELIDAVTGWTAAEGHGTATPADRTRIHAALYHRDLPLLADADLIAYDTDGEVVALAPLSEPVRRLLEWARDRESDPVVC